MNACGVVLHACGVFEKEILGLEVSVKYFPPVTM